MERFAILKFVNYRESTPQRAARLADYMQKIGRTDEKYIRANYLSPSNVKHGIEVIEERWKPNGTRSFKQGIISFGMNCTEFPPEKAADITKEILGFYQSYPWIAAVHINKPERIHSHFLLGTTNVRTGKKLSQGPRDLQQFKQFYNSVAERYGIPLVGTPTDGHSNAIKQSPTQPEKEVAPLDVYETAYPEPLYCGIPFETGGWPIMPAPPLHQEAVRRQWTIPDVVNTLLTCYQSNMARFFLLGYGKER